MKGQNNTAGINYRTCAERMHAARNAINQYMHPRSHRHITQEDTVALVDCLLDLYISQPQLQRFVARYVQASPEHRRELLPSAELDRIRRADIKRARYRAEHKKDKNYDGRRIAHRVGDSHPADRL